jgi:hypothetical protein
MYGNGGVEETTMTTILPNFALASFGKKLLNFPPAVIDQVG